jgi:hypothetical protein
MRTVPGAVLAAVALLPALAAAQGTRIQSHVPTPTPTHRAGFGVAPSVVNLPVHSPDRLDFPALWNGEDAVRTLSLTSNGKGFLSAGIPKGPFHILEYRELGRAIRSPSGQRTGHDVTKRLRYDPNDSRTLGWETEPDLAIEIDVIFNPKFDLASITAGDKTAALSLQGPGPMGAWQLAIPLHGVFHGVKLSATILVKDREPVIVRPAEALDVAVDVISPGSPYSGALRSGSLPAGVTVDPAPVSVEAGKTLSTRVRVRASAAVPADGAPREVGLVLDGSAAKAGLALVVVPDHVVIDRMVPECSLRDAHVVLSATPRYLVFIVQGASGDVFGSHAARFSATLGGREIMWGILHLPASGVGPVRPVKATYDTRRLPLDFDSNYGPADYPALVRGPVQFGCRVD